MKTYFLLFLLLNIFSEMALATNYMNQEGFICQKYSDGGVVASRNDYCANSCGYLYFPPTEEDKKNQGTWMMCRDMTNNRAYGLCPPVGQMVEPGTQTHRFLNRIVQDFKRCPNNEEYLLMKEAYALERPPVDPRAFQEGIERLVKEGIIKNRELRSKINQACKGLPKIDSKIIESLSSKFSSHPNSIKLERVALDQNSNCVATFYYPKGVISCRIENVDSANQLLVEEKYCK